MVELIEKNLVGYKVKICYIGGKAEGVLKAVGSRFLMLNTKTGTIFIRMGAIETLEPIGEKVVEEKK